MFHFLKRLGGPTPNFDSIHFDPSDWQPQELPSDELGPVWKTPAGDVIGLEIIRKRPKLPQSMDLAGYRNLFALSMQSQRGIPIELGSLQVSGCPAIHFVYKTPLGPPQASAPSDIAYAGTLTIPFVRFSFIYEVHCLDQGTGEARATGLHSRGITHEQRQAQQWPASGPTPDPDLARYDLEFPLSPVARLRSILGQIARTAVIKEPIASLPTCKLPS